MGWLWSPSCSDHHILAARLQAEHPLARPAGGGGSWSISRSQGGFTHKQNISSRVGEALGPDLDRKQSHS